MNTKNLEKIVATLADYVQEYGFASANQLAMIAAQKAVQESPREVFPIVDILERLSSFDCIHVVEYTNKLTEEFRVKWMIIVTLSQRSN